MDLNTYPYSIEIDNGEIVFLNHGDEDRIKDFIGMNNINISDKVDVWRLLCNDFLDTEIDKGEKLLHSDLLNEKGFTTSEIKKIKKRVNWTFCGTMEWNYLGHWDLLAMKQHRNPLYKYFGRDFYWWTMEIAMRGKTPF